MPEVRFAVEGPPVSKARHRCACMGGHPKMYTPKETKAYEASVSHAAREAMVRAGLQMVPEGDPVDVHVEAFFELPKSKHRVRNPPQRCPRTAKPDGDNVLKAILDGCNGVLYKDDAQVWGQSMRKWQAAQGEAPRVEVEVSW